MAELEGLQVYIPLKAEVKSVPLRSLPSSVLRQVNPSVELPDGSDCVWICPALLQRKGQKETPQEQAWAKQHMLTVLGNSVGKHWSSARGSAHWKMTFVTANTMAFQVLRETLPDPPSLPHRSVSLPQGHPSNKEQDAIVIHHGRIYMSMRRPRHRLSSSQKPNVFLQRQSSPQGTIDPHPDHGQTAPKKHNQLKRKLDSPKDEAARPSQDYEHSRLCPSPGVGPSEGAVSPPSGSNQRPKQDLGDSQGSTQNQTTTLGAPMWVCRDKESQEDSYDQSPPHSPPATWEASEPPALHPWDAPEPSARQRDIVFLELQKRENIAKMRAKLLNNGSMLPSQ